MAVNMCTLAVINGYFMISRAFSVIVVISLLKAQEK